MKLRPLEKSDEADLEKIIAAVYEEFDYSDEIRRDNLKNIKNLYEIYNSDTKSRYWVVEDDDKVLGGGGLKDFSSVLDGYAEIQKLYLSPAARGKGYGKLILDRLLVDAKELGFKSIYLETVDRMQAAINLYKKYGFEMRAAPPCYVCPEGCNTFMQREVL